MNHWGTSLESLGSINYNWQFLVIHLNQICSITSLLLGFSNNQSDSVSYVTNFICHQQWVLWFAHHFTIGEVDLPTTGKTVDVSHICARINGNDSVCSFSCCSINAFDFGMCQLAAKHIGVSHSRQYDIVSVFSCAGNEALVFYPLDGFSNHLTHEFLLMVSGL